MTVIPGMPPTNVTVIPGMPPHVVIPGMPPKVWPSSSSTSRPGTQSVSASPGEGWSLQIGPTGTLWGFNPSSTTRTSIPQAPLASGYKGATAAYGGTIPATTVPAAMQGIIKSDPFYSQQIALLNAQSAADAAQRSQNVGQALIQFGAVPAMQAFYGSGQMGPAPPRPTYQGPQKPNPANFAGGTRDRAYGIALSVYMNEQRKFEKEVKKWEELYGAAAQGPYGQDVTDLVRAAAQANTEAGLSVEARLAKQAADQRQAVINDLAARGLLDSGETGYQLGQQALASKQAEYDAAQQLQQYLQGVYAAFAQAEMQRQFGTLSALQDAYQRQAAAVTSGNSSIPTTNQQRSQR